MYASFYRTPRQKEVLYPFPARRSWVLRPPTEVLRTLAEINSWYNRFSKISESRNAHKFMTVTNIPQRGFLYSDSLILHFPLHHHIVLTLPVPFLLLLQMLNLTHDWLRSFLPHVLTKIDRVGFGLLTPADLQRALEVTWLTPGSPVPPVFGVWLLSAAEWEYTF